MKYISVLLFLISSLWAFNADIFNETVSNGKTVYIEFQKDSSLKYEYVLLDKNRYKIFQNPSDKTKMFALIPISYYAKPTHKKIEVIYKKNGANESKSMFIDIKDGNYEKETIIVNKSKVNPTDKKVQKRIAKEYNEAMKIYNHVENKSYINSKFIMPLESAITSDFGKARIYNNTLNGFHSGTDFRAKVGTPIMASNDGVVCLAKDRFYSGGTVIIDHGEGIYTCYFHMSGFNVKKGERVKKADIIGLSGNSGRVTGPHLHFAARVGGVQVDPLQLVSLLNKKLFKGTQ